MDRRALNDQRLAGLHPMFAARVSSFLAAMEVRGFRLLITQGLRTWAEQDALYAQGRTAPGKIVTQAPGGHSHHNFGLAIDVCPFEPGSETLLDWNEKHPVWQQVLAAAPSFWLAEGAKWRTFPDTPHLYPVEIPATTEELRAHYLAGGMDEVNRWFESLVRQEKGATP
jgi:peptidoglycan L-alanyl-D-glutamate endopeptidase CwlK